MAEKLRTDYDCLLTAHSDMKSQLALTEDRLAEKENEASLKSELEKAKAELEQLQIELSEVMLSRDKALSECSSLRSKKEGQMTTIDALNSQLLRSVWRGGGGEREDGC